MAKRGLTIPTKSKGIYSSIDFNNLTFRMPRIGTGKNLTASIGIALKPEQRAELARIAEQRRQTISQLLRGVIEDYLNQLQSENKEKSEYGNSSE